MQKLILFDFDGTIADSLDYFRQQINVLALKYKFKQVRHEELEMLRNSDPREIMKMLGISIWKVPFMGADFKRAFKKDLSTIPPVQDMNKTLIELKKQGFNVGILTSNAKDNVEMYLKKNNITVIDFVYGDVGMFGKSKRLLQVIKEKGLQKKDVFYVGDEIRDIEAARKAGISIVSVAWGYNSAERLKKTVPDFLADIPKDLLAFFTKQK